MAARSFATAVASISRGAWLWKNELADNGECVVENGSFPDNGDSESGQRAQFAWIFDAGEASDCDARPTMVDPAAIE